MCSNFLIVILNLNGQKIHGIRFLKGCIIPFVVINFSILLFALLPSSTSLVILALILAYQCNFL